MAITTDVMGNPAMVMVVYSCTMVKIVSIAGLKLGSKTTCLRRLTAASQTAQMLYNGTMFL